MESTDTLIESVDIPVTTQFIYRGTFRTDYTDNSPKARRYITYICQKLLVMRNKRTGNTDCFIMNLIPSKEYYKLHKNDVATQFLNSSEDINFSGIVLYSWLRDNSTVRVDVYKDGERVAAESIFNRQYSFEENHRRMRNIIAGARVFKFEKIKTRGSMEWVNFGGGETIWGGSLPEVVIPGHKPDPEFPENPDYTNPDNPDDPDNPDNPNNPDDPKPGVVIPGGPANTEDPIDPNISIKVQLSLTGTGTYTLLDEYTVSVSVTPAEKDPKRYNYDMSKQNGGKWEGLDNTTNVIKARFPGVFNIRAYINTDKGPIYSNTVRIEHVFPSRDQIIRDTQSHLDNLWEKTKNAYTGKLCREYGCVIYLDTRDDREGGYVFEDFVGDERHPNDQDIQVTLVSSSDMLFGLRTGGKFQVAHFHTHPALGNGSEKKSREVGPSEIDSISIVESKVPGLVYDYIGTIGSENNYYIYSGDEVTMPAKIYPFGLERKANTGF